MDFYSSIRCIFRSILCFCGSLIRKQFTYIRRSAMFSRRRAFCSFGLSSTATAIVRGNTVRRISISPVSMRRSSVCHTRRVGSSIRSIFVCCRITATYFHSRSILTHFFKRLWAMICCYSSSSSIAVWRR